MLRLHRGHVRLCFVAARWAQRAPHYILHPHPDRVGSILLCYITLFCFIATRDTHLGQTVDFRFTIWPFQGKHIADLRV